MGGCWVTAQKLGDFLWELSLHQAVPNVGVIAAKEDGLALLGSHASEVDAEGVQEKNVARDRNLLVVDDGDLATAAVNPNSVDRPIGRQTD